MNLIIFDSREKNLCRTVIYPRFRIVSTHHKLISEQEITTGRLPEIFKKWSFDWPRWAWTKNTLATISPWDNQNLRSKLILDRIFLCVVYWEVRNFFFRDKFMMCTNDPEVESKNQTAGKFLSRVKNDQIHQKIDLGAVLALEAKRRMRALNTDCRIEKRVAHQAHF